MTTFAFDRCALFVGVLATLLAWGGRPEKRHA
jgi:hypothetical protein